MSRVSNCENGQQSGGPNNAQDMQNVDTNRGTLLNEQPTSEEETVDYVVPNLRQSSGTNKVPDRYGFGLNPEEIISSEDGFRDTQGLYKVKRF